ncbi:MAG: response regulator [Chloroflexota bacterium]
MRILLADDHGLFRDGIASLVAAWGHEVVGMADTADSAIRLADAVEPDLVLMDIRMPGGGIEAARTIRSRRTETAVVMLTVSEAKGDLYPAIKAGASGYLLKNLRGDELRAMIEAVERGEAALSPATARQILDEFGRRARTDGAEPAEEPLTAAERAVLGRLTGGASNKEIAAMLGISENTVKYHLKHILAKLHAASRTEAATRAMREGLVPDEVTQEGRPPGA